MRITHPTTFTTTAITATCVIIAALTLLFPPPLSAHPTAQSASPTPATTATTASARLARLLEKHTPPSGPDLPTPYATVTTHTAPAVAMIARDDFEGAIRRLTTDLARTTTGTLHIETTLWLGIANAQMAINYPTSDTASEHATSAALHLQQAFRLDPATRAAPDALRVLAEITALGLTEDAPQAALDAATRKAETTRDALDFYYAGVLSRRLAAIAWAHRDTTELDQRTLALFAKALALDPTNYEIWSAYLPALRPVNLHAVADAEAEAMYPFFKNLRTPTLAEQGPAVLKITNVHMRTPDDDRRILDEVSTRWPDAPMPPFEIAMRAIETTPALALELFPKLIADFETRKLRPTPREAGYHVSALYKYAFLLHSQEKIGESLDYYKKVVALSPHYAEVHLNIAIINYQLAQKETDPAKKQQHLDEADTQLDYQAAYDYRGKTLERVGKLREEILQARTGATPTPTKE